MGLFNRTDNDDAERCPTSGWGVRPAATSSGKCPQGHEAGATRAGKGVVRIDSHKRDR